MSASKKESSEINKKAVVSTESETERLLRDMNRPDMEKFKLFTAMLRVNALYNRAKITHK